MDYFSEIITKNMLQLHHVYKALNRDDILRRAIAIQQIAAPTFEEYTRSAYIKAQFSTIGLDRVYQDSIGNVFGYLGSGQSVILVSAHLDTVFPLETDLSIREEKSRIYGPGLGDNSLGVAALLLLAEIFAELPIPPHLSICFVANTREEGLGNLDGIRATLERLQAPNIQAALVIEGMAFGYVYHAGIAVRRLKIQASAEGGHSWLGFGKPSAIHALVQLAADITRLSVPSDPRTTFNIGLIEGGHSVNSIATDAHLYLDLRSTSTAAVLDLEDQIHALIKKHQAHNLTLSADLVGDRPAGYISPDDPLIQLALKVLSQLGIKGGLEQGSTDANVLLAHHVPTLVVGVTQGGNAHRTDEFIETAPLVDGIWQLVLLLASTLDWRHSLKDGR